MTREIRKVAVIGAGAMGSGIAAQAANAGLEVVLLDKFEGVADKAIECMKKATPATDPFNAGFMHPSNAKRITTGTIDKDIGKIADCDMVIEAVFERLDIKQDTFGIVYENAPGAITTSNTSTIREEELTEGLPEEFKRNFINTHFFNPVRFMHLLELIPGKETDPEVLAAVRDFGDRVLGKKVILCKDRPGFIGNRIGCYAMFRTFDETCKQNARIEDVDAVMNRTFGFPKLGMYKLGDAVGLDIIHHVGQNLHNGLDADDHFNEIYDPAPVDHMVEDGYTGKKGKGGFYRVHEGRKEVLDMQTGQYRAAEQSLFFKKKLLDAHDGSFAKFFDSDDPAAKLSWPILRDTLVYVLEHAEEIAYDIQSIDEAMHAGYNWDYGPFELLDKFGTQWFTNKLEAEGIAVPALLQKADGRSFYQVEDGQLQVMNFEGRHEPVKREDGVIKLSDIKRASEPLIRNDSASLWDIGDGVVCLEFTSKANTLDPMILYALNESLKLIKNSGGKYKGLVLHNEGENYSVGANIGLVEIFRQATDKPFGMAIAPMLPGILKSMHIPKWAAKQLGKAISKLAPHLDKAYNSGAFADLKNRVKDKYYYSFIEDLVYQGQAVLKAMREANFPVVAAPKGLVLGGGCETLLWSDKVQAGAETYPALVELLVRLIPGWGGCTRLLDRAQKATGGDPALTAQAAFMAIADPQNGAGTSAQDAQRKLWLRPEDGISMNPDRILADAKASVLEMVEKGYEPPAPATFRLPGPAGKAAIRMAIDSLYLRGDDPAKGVNHVDVAVADLVADILTGGETLTEDEVDLHAASHHEALKDQMDQKPGNKLTINDTIELTEGRILQLERDAFMARVHEAETEAAIAHMVGKNKPLREKAPDPAPTPKEIRDNVRPFRLKRKNPDGQPLDGEEGKRLKEMSRTSSQVLRMVSKLGPG